ncbi:MAG: 3-phosphoglycerate dehydrogenase [Chloroflexi bacterium]|nr:3-phosphoglycerate dehydrogenase [Chloroflexota bacterium]
MKALVLAPLSGEALAKLRDLLPVTYESWFDTRRLADPEELARRMEAEGITILVVEADFLPEELFEQAPGLRMVAVSRSSLDHVDLEAATSHGVLVVNTPGRNAQAVAELALGLMLALSRRIPYLDSYVKQGRWVNPVDPYLSTDMRGAELGGKTLGIVGLGRVGSRVARLARAFDMRVMAYDPYLVTRGAVEEASPPANPFDMVSSLPELAAHADYISIHVPESPDTRGLIDRAVLSAMKPNCRIVNTSSYQAVEEGALVDVLREGRLAGAAFDVFQTHPIPPNSPLLSLDNVILTPHIGGATQETINRHSEMIVEDINRFLTGLRPLRLVNAEVWAPNG